MSPASFFGAVGSLSWIRSGFEAEEPTLQKIQDDALAKRSPAIARALFKTSSGRLPSLTFAPFSREIISPKIKRWSSTGA